MALQKYLHPYSFSTPVRSSRLHRTQDHHASIWRRICDAEMMERGGGFGDSRGKDGSEAKMSFFKGAGRALSHSCQPRRIEWPVQLQEATVAQ